MNHTAHILGTGGIGIAAGFKLIETIPFNKDAYPGYLNRRGAGKQGGKRFPCDDAVTYIFRMEAQAEEENENIIQQQSNE